MKLHLLSWVSWQVLRTGICTVNVFLCCPPGQCFGNSSGQCSLQPSTLSPAVTTADVISRWLIGRGHHLLSILLVFPQHLQLSYRGIGGHIPREAQPVIFKTGRRVVALQPALCKAHVTSYRQLCWCFHWSPSFPNSLALKFPMKETSGTSR